MILQLLLSGLFNFVHFIFGLFPDLPQVPSQFSESINYFLDFIFDSVGLFTVFVRPSTVVLIVPIVVLLINFDKVVSLVMWVVRKIPFIGSE